MMLQKVDFQKGRRTLAPATEKAPEPFRAPAEPQRIGGATVIYSKLLKEKLFPQRDASGQITRLTTEGGAVITAGDIAALKMIDSTFGIDDLKIVTRGRG